METINTARDAIYAFRAPQSLLDDTFKKILQIKFFENHYNKISFSMSNDLTEQEKNLAKNSNFSELHQWFQACLREVAIEKGYKCDFKIIHSWANKSEKNQKHHEHNHPMAVISGVFYLTSAGENGGGETYYVYSSNSWHKSFLTYINKEEYHIKPEAGKLILFPSILDHGVLPHNEENPRYTIAFDSFPVGQIANMKDQGIDLKINIEN